MSEINFSEIKEAKNTNKYDNYAISINQLNIWYNMYYDEQITLEKFKTYASPTLVKITNHYNAKFYASLRKISGNKEQFTNTQYKNQQIFDNEFWGIDNVYKAFIKSVEMFDFDKTKINKLEYEQIASGETTRFDIESNRFTHYFAQWLNSEFANALKKAKKCHFNKEGEFIKMQELSIDDENNNVTLNKTSKVKYEDDLTDIHLKNDIRYFIDKYLPNKTDATIFGFVMIKWETGKTLCNEDIARCTKVSERTVINKKKYVIDLFKKYLKGELK